MSGTAVVLVGLIGLGLLRVLAGLVSKLVSSEIEALLVDAARRILQFASRLLPEPHRNDYKETWSAELDQLEKRPLKAIWFAAFHCLLSARALSRELQARSHASSPASSPVDSVAPPSVPSSPRGLLTPRQIQVVQLTADGLALTEIARALDMSVVAVKTHRKNAAERIGAQNATALVALALRMDLVH